MLTVILIILWLGFIWWATGLFCGTSRFAPKFSVPDVVENHYPALKDGYRWDVRKALILPLNRVYLQEEGGIMGWRDVAWHPFSKDMGAMQVVEKDYNRWWDAGSTTLASAMGYTLYNNPHAAAGK